MKEWRGKRTVEGLGRAGDAARGIDRIERATGCGNQRAEDGFAEQSRDRLIHWYKARAAERVQARVPTWATKLGVTPRQIWIRDPKSRWGSADRDGNLRFNWRIVQAPTALLDDVVAHALAHLLHPDHTPAFGSALGQAMPDDEARRDKLRRFGPKLVW